jgi:hypothetical protein
MYQGADAVPVDPEQKRRWLVRAFVMREGNVNRAAKKWGVPQATLDSYLKGTGGMSAKTFSRILGALGMDEFTFYSAYPAQDDSGGTMLVSPEQLRARLMQLNLKEADELVELLQRAKDAELLPPIVAQIRSLVEHAERVAEKEKPVSPSGSRGSKRRK